MESIPPEIISHIGRFLDIASASTLEHVLYKQPFKRVNSLNIVIYSLEFFKLWSRYVDPNDICTSIAECGTFEMFEWAMERFPLKNFECLINTFISSNSKIAEIVIKNTSYLNCSLQFILSTFKYVCLDIIKLMWEHNFIFGLNIYVDAIFFNRIDILDWLHEIGCNKDENLIVFAVDSGHKEAIDWCHKMKCPWTTQAWNAAVEKCDIPTIEYLISLGYNTNTLRRIIQTSDNPILNEWVDLNL